MKNANFLKKDYMSNETNEESIASIEKKIDAIRLSNKSKTKTTYANIKNI